MKVTRTEQSYIGYDEHISRLCHLSKNLYNQSNYLLRQQFMNRERQTGYVKLVKLFQYPSEDDNHNNYQKLPAQTAQWTIKRVKQSWNSFFKSIKDYRKHPEKYLGRPRIPGYKSKDGEFILTFTNQQCSMESGILRFPRIIDVKVKTRLDNVNLREVRIVPQGVGYTVEIVYEKNIPDPIGISTARALAIDIGVNNLVTIVNSIGVQPIAVRGGLLKSINQYCNKEYSRLKSISDRQLGNRHLTKREEKLFMKRNRKIRDVMHKVSRSIVTCALSEGVDTIVIGHNDGWKQESNMGRRNNQNFVQIPFSTLIDMLRYKGEDAGIQVVVQEESHTSKCSFLDSESIEHHDEYEGKRIKRGLFRSSEGTIINADVNGAYNIGRKAFPNLFRSEGIEASGLKPRSLSIGQMITSKGVC